MRVTCIICNIYTRYKPNLPTTFLFTPLYGVKMALIGCKPRHGEVTIIFKATKSAIIL